VEGRAEVDRDDRVPLGGGKLLDRRHVLDAGVVDEDVDAAELGLRVGHHRLDLGRLAHVGPVVAGLHAERGHLGARRLEFAEAVEHHVGALARQAQRDAVADAAGGAGDEGGFSFEHGGNLQVDTVHYRRGSPAHA
jgi:hypothetical protein